MMPTSDAVDPPSVLIIEDSHDVADSLGLYLEYICHYRVTIAYDGDAGISAAFACEPDVVVCDIGLPKKDGYQVATSISCMSRRPLLIAVSAYGDDDSQGRARAAGFDHYLVKPADPEELEGLIEAKLKRASDSEQRQ
jgi:DNA-binding response OmpR family regulator